MKSLLAEGHYFGCRKESRKAGALLLTECTYAPGVQVPEHSHENPYLIFTLNGCQEEVFGVRHRVYVPGTLAIHPAGEVHREKLGPEGMRCLHVEFGIQWMKRHGEISRVLERPAQFQDGNSGWLAQRIYREFRHMDDVAPAAIEGLALEVLAEASRRRRPDSSGKRPRWLGGVQELIRARFAEPLSLSEVAAWAGVHPVSLARAFRNHYRCSVGEFIRQVRIESACEVIRSQDLSLTEVGLVTGFADQAHFSRTFKRVTGMTPGQFRATRGNR